MPLHLFSAFSIRIGKNRDALLALASAFFGLHQYDKAGEVYARELRLNATDSEAWYGAGLTFEQVAEGAARKLAELGKGSAYNQRLMGEYLIENDAGIEAEEALRRALTLGAKDGEGLHAALGFALLRLEEPSKARDEFRSELRLHPGNLDGKLGLAAVEMQQRHIEDGFAHLCGILQVDEGYLQARASFFVTFLGQNIESEINENAGAALSSSHLSKGGRTGQNRTKLARIGFRSGKCLQSARKHAWQVQLHRIDQ